MRVSRAVSSEGFVNFDVIKYSSSVRFDQYDRLAAAQYQSRTKIGYYVLSAAASTFRCCHTRSGTVEKRTNGLNLCPIHAHGVGRHCLSGAPYLEHEDVAPS